MRLATSFAGSGKNKDLNTIEDNEIILDIGPKTIKNIKDKIEPIKYSFMEWPSRIF